jgi:hypothetical protein
MISALFVETDGVYFDRPGVDPWNKNRDALKYAGPNPVVAHPPCQLWGSMAFVNFKRWGGEHNKPGNDGGCFAAALDAVQRYGGVLEHPAKTRAWVEFEIQRPFAGRWTQAHMSQGDWIKSGKSSAYVCEVWQSAYGHKANKATWLYYVGKSTPFDLDWNRPIGSHQCGFHDQRGKDKNKPTISGKKASRTPEKFAEVLIALAECSRTEKAPQPNHPRGVCDCPHDYIRADKDGSIVCDDCGQSFPPVEPRTKKGGAK